MFHISVGFHATQSICPGVQLSTPMGVAAKRHMQQNPKKVSLPPALSPVYLYTYNHHYFIES